MDIRKYEPLWGTWHLERVIGGGSSGTVYEAKQNMLGRTYTCAVKHISIPRDEAEHRAVMEQMGSEDSETLRSFYEQETLSFVREYEIQKAFAGKENFVQVQDVLSIPKEDMPGYDLFIRMELLGSIFSRFTDQMNSSEREKEAVRLGSDVCRALREMHENHYMHRDIKPQNILVSESGVYKLADFGSAREFSGKATFMSITGTMDYIAPELMLGRKADFTADLYSLGLVLYQLMNRRSLPFASHDGSGSSQDAAARRLSGETLPAPSDASPAMAQVILKACSYRPEDRFSSADAMLSALEGVLEANQEKQEALYQEALRAIQGAGRQSASWSDIRKMLGSRELDHYRNVEELRDAVGKCCEGHAALEQCVSVPEGVQRPEYAQKTLFIERHPGICGALFLTVLAVACIAFDYVPDMVGIMLAAASVFFFGLMMYVRWPLRGRIADTLFILLVGFGVPFLLWFFFGVGFGGLMTSIVYSVFIAFGLTGGYLLLVP